MPCAERLTADGVDDTEKVGQGRSAEHQLGKLSAGRAGARRSVGQRGAPGLLLFCSLANDFLGLLVLPQTEEGWLAQMAVARPFGETHFADELGVEPGATFHFSGGQAAAKAAGFFRQIDEGTIAPNQFLKSPVE